MSLAFNFLAVLCAIAFSIGDGNANFDALEEIKTPANPDITQKVEQQSNGKRRLSLYTNRKTPWKPRTRNLRSTMKQVDSEKLYVEYQRILNAKDSFKIKDVGTVMKNIGFAGPSHQWMEEIPISYALLHDIVNGNEIKDKYAYNEGEMKEAFEEFDSDASGNLSSAELLQVIRQMGIVEVDLKLVEEMINEVDGDKTGNVSFAEFIMLWNMNFV